MCQLPLIKVSVLDAKMDTNIEFNKECIRQQKWALR